MHGSPGVGGALPEVMSLKSPAAAEYAQDALAVWLSAARLLARRSPSRRATTPAHIGAARLVPPMVPLIQAPLKARATPVAGSASMATSGLTRLAPEAIDCQLGFDSKADGPPPVP